MTHHILAGIHHLLSFISEGFAILGMIMIVTCLFKKLDLHPNAYLCVFIAQFLYIVIDMFNPKLFEIIFDSFICTFSLVIYIVLRKTFYKKLDLINENF